MSRIDHVASLVLAVSVLLISACSNTPKKVAPVSLSSAGYVLPPLTRYALSLVGAPYRYGSASIEDGFDCSGFVWHVYRKHGILLPRTAKQMAVSLPRTVDLQSGDLVFFDTGSGSFSHVGLFVNGDRFVHAPSSRTGRVLVSSLNNPYWRRHYTGARRALVHTH